MTAQAYLLQGLSALARAHRAGSMAGHLGAAVLAGSFLGEEQYGLRPGVVQGIHNELKRIIAGEEAIWFNPAKAGITVRELFDPMPAEPPSQTFVASFAAALARNIDQTRQSGHNVIFASIAMRALIDHPESATPAVVSGVQTLIEGFDTAGPGQGYYGKSRGWLHGQQGTSLEEADLPPYGDESDMVRAVLNELIASASLRRQGYGGLWHLINHAAALTELSRFGLTELARQGLPAHRNHLRLWRALPDLEAELGPVEKATHDPRDPAYWQGPLKRDDARLTHRIKTLYGFLTLLRAAESPAVRAKAQEAFLYLMA